MRAGVANKREEEGTGNSCTVTLSRADVFVFFLTLLLLLFFLPPSSSSSSTPSLSALYLRSGSATFRPCRPLADTHSLSRVSGAEKSASSPPSSE